MRLSKVEDGTRPIDESRQEMLVPWASSLSVCGRTSELEAIVAYVADALEEDGWTIVESIRDPSPLAALELARDIERLHVALSEAPATRLRRYAQYELLATGRVRDRVALDAIFDAIPFTDYELESIRHDMPLTASVGTKIADWLPSLADGEISFKGYGAIFTIHHQTDFLLLLEQALRLGLDRSLVTVIDKEYRYAHAHRVDAHVRQRLGVSVFTYTDLSKGLSDHIRRVDAAKRDSGAETWRSTLVVDDGGYILPVLLDEFESSLGLFKGVVEQTTSGIWRLRPYERERIPIPVFSVAESELKSSVEAHGVAAAAVSNLRRLFPNEHFGGRAAVIVGFGTIGEALAGILRQNHCNVFVADAAASRVAAARERGYMAAVSTTAVLEQARPRFVFACGGERCVGADCFDALVDDCYLVSVTSRDFAFDKQGLERGRTTSRYGDLGTLYLRADSTQRLMLVADGFPINFHFAESMPNQQSDLVMASLLAGALELANATPTWPAGNDPARANMTLNSGSLLDDYNSVLPAIGLPEADD